MEEINSGIDTNEDEEEQMKVCEMIMCECKWRRRGRPNRGETLRWSI